MAINILIVDDSPIMRRMIKKTINLCGLSVGEIYEAGNGREGLDRLEDKEVHLLFIDVNMPVMDGMEMLHRVRDKPSTRQLPVLIISTESNKNRIETIDNQDAGFVHKPFTPELLKSKILEIKGIPA